MRVKGKYNKVKVVKDEYKQKAFCKLYNCLPEDYYKYRNALTCESCGVVFGEPKTRFAKCTWFASLSPLQNFCKRAVTGESKH